MDKIREIFSYFVAALAMFAFLGAVYQAFQNEKGSALTLGSLFLVGALIVFLPQVEFIKTLGVEAKLRQAVTEAVATLENLKRLSATSAKSNYLSAAWSNRREAPTAKEKQAVLDEVDKQLIDLKISDEERREITRPYVQMVGFDLYDIYVRVFDRYRSWKSEELMRIYNANKTSEAKLAVETFQRKNNNWLSRSLGRQEVWQGLESKKLAAELENASPNAWLEENEIKAAEDFKNEILRLFNDCEIKRGFTPEAADFYDKYQDLGGYDRKIIELFGVNPSEFR